MPLYSLYTFTSAKDELRLRMGRGASSTDLDARLKNWLDAAQLRIAQSAIPIPDLEDQTTLRLANGQSEYDLVATRPSLTNIIGIEHVRNSTTGQRMMRFPWVEYRSLTTQATGNPLRWTRRGYVVAFDPQPDTETDVLFEVRKRPELGVVVLPSEWQEDWIRLAAVIGWSALQQHDRTRALTRELPISLQAAINQELSQDEWEANYDSDLAIWPETY